LYTVTEGSNLYSPVEVCSLVGNVLPPQQTGKPTLVVITGGEPLRQTNVGQLVIYLLVTNHLVQIETNGSLDLPEDLMYLYQKNSPLLERLTIVCSPKTSIVAPTLWNRCHYKFVLQKGRVDSYGLPTKVLDMGVDFTWMHDLIRNLPPGLNTYVQPYDEGSADKNLEHIRVTVDSSLSFGHRVSLQLHKLLGLE
jgi:organic radical activating enzyme